MFIQYQLPLHESFYINLHSEGYSRTIVVAKYFAKITHLFYSVVAQSGV